ncbi:MAG TPA: hypothetical protein VGJ09_04940, partial [Bryobacteraceae bacterium]
MRGIFRLVSVAFSSLPLLLIATDAQAQSLWTLSGGGVWDIPNQKRVAWNPATGAIGNMGQAGVIFSVNAAPANVQAGAAAQAANGYLFWNQLAAIPSVRINFVPFRIPLAAPKSIVSWGAPGAGVLGDANNPAINFNNRDITLSNTLTLRSDGWNIRGAVNQFDTSTINVHEAGHVLGLNHPGAITQIMTQTGASLGAGGRFKTVEQVTPFAGQPLGLNAAGVPANALAAGTPTYNTPRSTFGFGDALGAMTLYSAPISRISSAFAPLGIGTGRFTYMVNNDSAEGTVGSAQFSSAYDEKKFVIPVAPGVPVSNLIAPSGYTITRESSDVLVQSTSPSFDLKPGGQLQFSFDSTDQLAFTKPNAHWSIFGLGTDSTEDPSLDPDSDGPAVAPPFDINDFGVLDGTYDYQFNAATDNWDIVPFADVVTPIVPEPAMIGALCVGLVGLVPR